jgi:hypothetical protein
LVDVIVTAGQSAYAKSRAVLLIRTFYPAQFVRAPIEDPCDELVAGIASANNRLLELADSFRRPAIDGVGIILPVLLALMNNNENGLRKAADGWNPRHMIFSDAFGESQESHLIAATPEAIPVIF